MTRWLSPVVALLLLAGCAGGGGWTKPGVDQPAAAQAYRGCRATAERAVRPEIGINEDILATRGTDWQRAQIGEVAREALRAETRDRAAAIIDDCMRAKGFARAS